MGVFENIRGRRDHRVAQSFAQSDAIPATDPEKEPTQTPKDLPTSDSDTDALSLSERNEKEVQAHPDQVTPDALPGQQKAEAAAIVWSKKAVWATYAWIWVCFFMLALQQGIGNNVIANAYANFADAPAISTATVLASIIGGILRLPIAKVLNIWGRAEGFTFFVGVYLLGIIVIASCNGPNGYAAGYVLYWIGYDAIYFILDIFVADVSGLRNRAFAFGFVSMPFICTAFTAPLAAASFLNTSNWRWAYGAFAIIMPFVFLPLSVVFKYYQIKAEKMGVLQKDVSGRTAFQSLVHYIHEFDVVGALILIAAFVLFLLPFSLNGSKGTPYHSASFIAMVVIGFCLFFVFAAWEKWFARVHFIRWELFKQRTILGACLLSAVLYVSFYNWDLYYYSFVMVVYNLNLTETGYMTQIYNVGSTFWSVVFGVWIRATKHFKYTCLFFGLPLMFLGSGLLIHFRGSDSGIGYLVMCQIFIAFAGGTLVIGQDMAVMAAADRDGVPLMLSLINLSSSIGGAIGQSIGAAIYRGTFQKALVSRLPADMVSQATTINLGGYLVQMAYPVGSQTRDAINYAWGRSQMWECVASTVSLVVAIPAIAMWKNYNVNKQQNKGYVI